MKSFNATYYLPHSFKRLGWVLLGVSVIPFIVLVILIEGLKLLPVSDWAVTVAYLFPTGLTLGLILVISSREKREDEMIRMIRLKSFQYGLFFAVGMFYFSFLFRSIGALIPSPGLAIEGIWILPAYMFGRLDTITATLLYIAIIYHFKLWRLRSDEE